MTTAGVVHTVFAVCALALGLIVVLMRKGTRVHRTMGHFYVSSMLGLNVSALSIYHLFGAFGPFHVLAVVSLATLAAGMLPPILRRPRRSWFELHARFMAWSYAGLLAAAAAELVVRVPVGFRNFGVAVTGASGVVILLAASIIHGGKGRVIGRAIARSGIIKKRHEVDMSRAILALLVASMATVGRTAAQEARVSPIDSIRHVIDVAVANGDASSLRSARAYLENNARVVSAGLRLHLEGYALYREATALSQQRNTKAQVDSLLTEARDRLEQSAKVLKLPETHALLATVIGQQMGASPLRAILSSGRFADEMERAMQLGPQNPRVHLLRGINAFYTPAGFGGGLKAAQTSIEQAIVFFDRDMPKPEMPAWGKEEAFAWLGAVHERRGDRSAAERAYRRALEVNPNYGWVRHVLLPRLLAREPG